MTKKSVFDQPGVEQLVPGHELPVAVKVTGRNLHAVSLLASVAGETNAAPTRVTADFKADGSLANVTLLSVDDGASLNVEPGSYLVMTDKTGVIPATQAELDAFKGLLPLLTALDSAIARFAGLVGILPR